jgi:hypothetical protein
MVKSTGSTLVRMATAVALMMGLASVASAAAQHAKQPLRATAAAPSARGRAKLVLKNGAHGSFAIASQKLAPATSYEVVVDGIKVGAITTGKNGAGKIKFSAPKRGNAILMGFDPRGASVAVRNGDGDDVLEGDMPDDGTDPNAVACCLTDDDEVECKDRTPEACLAAGGEVSSATGCFPNPCVSAPGVVCCIGDSASGAFCDDGPEVECEHDLSAQACAAAHGTVVEATSCEPNPCAPVPPANLVVCCVPEDDETECEIRTPERCASHGGTVSTATSCAEHPCGPSDDDDDQGEDDDGDHHGGDDHEGGGDGHGDDD